jgi:uncharacterized membrane-anchored protein
MKKFVWLLCLTLLINTKVSAGESDTSANNFMTKLLYQDSILKSFHYKRGTVSISDNLATINVPEGCLFLEAKEARILLEDLYNNPPNTETLGLLLSDTPSVLTGARWVVEYTYSSDGHVKDDDARDTKFDELLETLKKNAEEASAERVKGGYESEKLIGWAQAPFYDAENKKLHWAMEYEFGGDSAHTLNYNVRVLGRKGYLVMNIIAGMDMLGEVNKNINKILASTNFNEGNRYADFDSNIDKIAEYGIGGLIAGGILAKTGLLAKLGLILLKFSKLIIVAIGGLFVALRNRIFGKKKQAVIPVTTNTETPENPAE